MVCTLAPTGDPVLSGIATPVDNKVYNAALDQLIPLIVVGYDTHFEVEWVPNGSITDQIVSMVYMEDGATVFEQPLVSTNQLTGVLSSATGYDPTTEFKFWIRRETVSEVGPWYYGTAKCEVGWTYFTEPVSQVYRLTVNVEHGGETVLYSG